MTMTVSTLNYFVGKGIVSVYTGAAEVKRWSSCAAYQTNDHVILQNGTIYKATAGGTAGSTEPTTVGADGSVTWAAVTLNDVGNVSKFDFQEEVRTLEHVSSRSGVGSVDLIVDTQRRAKLSLALDEITMENLELALLGTMAGTAGSRHIALFNAARSNVVFQMLGTNSVGKQFKVVVPSCRINPAKSISFIGDKFGELEVDADVFAILPDSSFGTILEL